MNSLLSAPIRVALGMRTVRREKENYLGQTIRNLTRSNVFDSDHFVSLDIVDSGSSEAAIHFHDQIVDNAPPSNAHLISFHTLASPTPNETATEVHRLMDSRKADVCIFLEDDIDVCNNFLESVVAWIRDHYTMGCLFSFGANYPQVSDRLVGGYSHWTYPVRAFYGTQCYAVLYDTHKHLTKWLIENPYYIDEHGNKKSKCHDLRLHQWAETLDPRRNFVAAVPSFVQHIGEQSSLGCRFFKFRTWQGPEWSYSGGKNETS